MESVNHGAISEGKPSSSHPSASWFGRLRQKLAGGYNYDVRNSYSYDFGGTKAVVGNVDLVHGSFELPPVGEGGHTALLKVSVKASLPGRFIHPRIEITAGEITEVQYFERGGAGIRYVDISPFLGSKPRKLELRGKHIEIDDGSIELVLFKNEVPSDPTVLVIAPHPDDAEIAAYGLYSDSEHAYIVTVTAGDAGAYNYNRVYGNIAEHSLKKGELRSWNSITVPMLGGMPPERSINLGFFEGRLKEMCRDKGTDISGVYSGVSDVNTFRKYNLSPLASELDGSANWNSLVANLARLLARIKPDIIVTPHPILDVQEDHRYSTYAVFEALKQAAMHDGCFYFYTNHIQFNHLYPYGRMGSVVSLPPVFGQSPFFTSIYSHQLSSTRQKDKMFALEAMNDLRLNVDRKFSTETTMAALKAPLKEALGYDDSYYRRAVRANELFFVVEFKDVYDEVKLALLTGQECLGHE